MRPLYAFFASMIVMFSSFDARAEDDPNEDKAPSVVTSGLLVFLGSYAASAAMTASYREHKGHAAMTMAVPVVGPWMTLKAGELSAMTTLTGRLVTATGADRCGGDAIFCPGELAFLPVAIIEYAFLIFDPIAQATGIVMAFAGAATAEKRLPQRQPEPVKVSVRPAMIGTGPGMSLSITRW